MNYMYLHSLHVQIARNRTSNYHPVRGSDIIHPRTIQGPTATGCRRVSWARSRTSGGASSGNMTGYPKLRRSLRALKKNAMSCHVQQRMETSWIFPSPHLPNKKWIDCISGAKGGHVFSAPIHWEILFCAVFLMQLDMPTLSQPRQIAWGCCSRDLTSFEQMGLPRCQWPCCPLKRQHNQMILNVRGVHWVHIRFPAGLGAWRFTFLVWVWSLSVIECQQ